MCKEITDISDPSDVVTLDKTPDVISVDPIKDCNTELCGSGFKTEFSPTDTTETDSLMSNAADTYTAEDVSSAALDSSSLNPSDLSGKTDDYETNAGFDIANLMDEAAIKTSEDLASDTDQSNEIESLMNDFDSSNDPAYLSQIETEALTEDFPDKDAFQSTEEGIESDDAQFDTDDTAEGDGANPVRTRDPSELWESGNRAIDQTIEVMRDDLRDKGLEDGPEMESIVMEQRALMQDELGRNIQGDFSNPYQKPDFEELIREYDVSEQPAENGQEIPQDIPEQTAVVTDLQEETDHNKVFDGLDNYDFDGIDYASDTERLDASLDSFDSATWEGLSLDEQKSAMSDLADYVEDVIGFDNPPEIVYYNNPEEGDYGEYSPGNNTLRVNEYMLYNNEEAADTVAHELWHAYQHQRASNPQNAKDYQYQYGFEHYIRYENDYDGYKNQLIEAEASAFAQQFKDRLNIKGRRM